MRKPSEIRVLLVRTGETEWERDDRIAGHADVPLSEGGRRAVADIARDLDGVRIGTVFCGPDGASLATADAIAAATGARVRPVESLAEVNLGLWEGMRHKELEEKCPRARRQWLDDPTVVQVPEGEPVDEAQDRILEGLGKILDKVKPDQGAVAVILRPMAMGLVGCALNGVPTRNLWPMMKSGLAVQWQTVQRGVLRQGLVQARAGV